MDCLVTLMALGMIALVAWPAVGSGRSRSLLAVCANGLRTIGQALTEYSAETDSQKWQNRTWLEISRLSNSIPNPRVFACPADTGARPATKYTVEVSGGFLHAGYQDNAVSYALGLDSSIWVGDSVLAADRNLRHEGFGSCSTGVTPAWTVRPGATGWRPGANHDRTGNLLLRDGRVESASSTSVNRWYRDVDAGLHFMIPRPNF